MKLIKYTLQHTAILGKAIWNLNAPSINSNLQILIRAFSQYASEAHKLISDLVQPTSSSDVGPRCPIRFKY